MPPRTFAMNLKRLRLQRGLTQIELAKKLKMKQPHLAMLESGAKPNPTLHMLRRLAKALKVKLADLLRS